MEAESGTERRRENRRARKKREELAGTQKQSDKGVEVQKTGARDGIKERSVPEKKFLT